MKVRFSIRAPLVAAAIAVGVLPAAGQTVRYVYHTSDDDKGSRRAALAAAQATATDLKINEVKGTLLGITNDITTRASAESGATGSATGRSSVGDYQRGVSLMGATTRARSMPSRAPINRS